MIADETLRIGVYVCHCGSNIAGMVDVEAWPSSPRGCPAWPSARHYKYMCSDPGQELVKRDIAEHGLTRIVVAACSPHLHEPTFRRAAEDAGLNRFLVQMTNIREQVSWVTRGQGRRPGQGQGPPGRGHPPRRRPRAAGAAVRADHPRALVIGGGIAGIQAALTLADAGNQVYPRRARAVDRRAHGQVRQDLPHAGLLGLHPHAEDVRGRSSTERSRC